VLNDLKSANFDPEMCRKYEDDIIGQFNVQYGTSLSPARKKRWWQDLINT